MKKQDIVYMLKMMGDIVKHVIWAEREGCEENEGDDVSFFVLSGCRVYSTS